MEGLPAKCWGNDRSVGLEFFDLLFMHDKPLKEVFAVLQSSEQGLHSTEAQLRLQKYGLNELKKEKRLSIIALFLNQFRSMLVYILLAATLISLVLKEYIDGFAILAIVILNAILGFIQEYRAEKSIEALKKLASLKAKVIRDGTLQEIPTTHLVKGDVIVLETGDKVPADARIISESNLETMEASLTGESTPVEKNEEILQSATILAERYNMVYTGTIIVKGHAQAMVVGTGMKTEIGKIATMLEETEVKLTPLQKRLESLGKKMGYGTIIICIVVFLVSLAKIYVAGSEFTLAHALDLFLVAVALAVAAVPEGLPIVVTISLALGVQRMVKRHALIRKLPSVETLGSTTVICSDKTGTLTKNEMTVQKMYVNNHLLRVSGVGYKPQGEFWKGDKKIEGKELKELEMLLMIGALNNDACVEHNDTDKVFGDPTEGCLIVSAEKAGLHKKQLEEKYPRINEVPFDSTRKRMTTIHRFGKKQLALVKGAPDSILPLCTKMLVNNKLMKLDNKTRQKIHMVNNQLAQEALRTLGFAYREVSSKELNKGKHLKTDDIEKDLIFVGLQGMIDPPREEVMEAIARCKTAGIKVIMITGDHEVTAQAIAQELGIEGRTVNGKNLVTINLDQEVENIGVYARVNPEDKMKIISALRKKGHVVAMTGDGVNDAPALKDADLGIAMGITGTDVAKEASAMILTDDNFTSIVNAIEEGRGIYDNIKKFIVYLLSCNIAEVLVIFLAIVLGMPLPLMAIQLLLINLVTDGLPATSLGADPYEPGGMKRRPLHNSDTVFKGMYPFLIVAPLLMCFVVLSVFGWFLAQDVSLMKAQTAVLVTMVMFELYRVYSCRSLRYSSLSVGMFKNWWLNMSVLISLGIMLLVMYVPTLQKIFDTVALSLTEVLVLAGIASIGFIYLEVHKFVRGRREMSV